MKNANSRFVRVLAVALVVLMVLPAALVGCGSNKANDAAISEALAAAQAAKDAATGVIGSNLDYGVARFLLGRALE